MLDLETKDGSLALRAGGQIDQAYLRVKVRAEGEMVSLTLNLDLLKKIISQASGEIFIKTTGSCERVLVFYEGTTGALMPMRY